MGFLGWFMCVEIEWLLGLLGVFMSNLFVASLCILEENLYGFICFTWQIG